MKTYLTHSLIAVAALTLTAGSIAQNKNHSKQANQSEAISKNTRWKEEPTSFAGLSLTDQITLENCPFKEERLTTMTLHMVDLKEVIRRIEANEGIGCVEENLDYRNNINKPPQNNMWGGGTGYFKILLFKDISPLAGIRLHAHEGRVERMEISFATENYEKVKDILVERYGAAHQTEAIELRTNGGAVIPAEAMNWIGEKFSLEVRSTVERSFDSTTKTIRSRGNLVIFNNELKKYKSELEKNKTKSTAEKL